MFLFLFLFCFRVGLMRKLQMSTDASLGPCDLALVYNYSATTPTGAIPSVSAASASIGRGVAIIHIHADTTAQKVQQVQQQALTPVEASIALIAYFCEPVMSVSVPYAPQKDPSTPPLYAMCGCKTDGARRNSSTKYW